MQSRLDERLEKLIEKRIDRLEVIARIMEGDHSLNLPPQKNHLDRWEMLEVERVNRWRTPESQLDAPTPSMYEASRLQRYLPDEQRGLRVSKSEGARAADG